MHDVAEGGDVVAATDLGRKPEQPDEHGRHHEQVAQSVTLDRREQRLRVELWGEPDLGAGLRHAEPVEVGGRMVHGPGDQGAGVRAEPEDLGHQGRRLGGVFGRDGEAPHALGAAGRARGVEDHRGRLDRRGRRGLEPVDPGGPLDHVFRRSTVLRRDIVGGGDLGRRLDNQHSERGQVRSGQPAPQVGVHDEHLGGAVGQDVTDLVRGQAPVQRHGEGADQAGAPAGLEHGQIVAQQQRHRVARLDAEMAQPRGHLRRARGQRPPVQNALAPDHSSAHRLLRSTERLG